MDKEYEILMTDDDKKVPRGFVADSLFNFTFEDDEDVEEAVNNAIDKMRKSFDEEEK